MEQQVKQVIDPAIVLGKYQAKDLDKKRGMSDFIIVYLINTACIKVQF